MGTACIKNSNVNNSQKLDPEKHVDFKRRAKREPSEGNRISKSKISTTTILENIRDYYEFVKVIGHGHFGTVRLAQNKNSKLSYAIKSIPKEKVKSELYLLKRELDVLRLVDHANIIKFYETYEDDRYLHIVMEFCSGGELFSKISKKGALQEEDAANIMKKIFSAINHLHERQIVHRDLKPENFLFESSEEDAEIKIIDFGLANKFQDKKQLATIVGTPYYVAPEVLKGQYGCYYVYFTSSISSIQRKEQ